MQSKRIAGALGALVTDIDLTQPLSATEVNEIRTALLSHQVLFFRDQALEPAHHEALASAFGSPQLHEAYPHVPGHPAITILENDRDNPSKIEVWHTDMTFRACPPLGSILHGVVVPPQGGDTLFASLSAAYDSLSPSIKDFVQKHEAIHDFSHGFKESLAEPGGHERLAPMVRDNPPVVHPMVVTHPESGIKGLYVNALFTVAIKGLTQRESDAMLNLLFEHIVLPEHTCRFSWEANSIAFWDNRITQHKPVNDYWPQHRKMQRITVDDGQRPS
ncbi:MAG: TauD/TfdA family dioxygenase [Pseudomonadales bacterium]|jgi:taurine dioxygenase|nr:TauD/TfdA family dioxygenase [Pseudomonadales bacterium]MDA0958714.1 TauD/TfdA family dioxygenase [Pseudomonadota bacterium]